MAVVYTCGIDEAGRGPWAGPVCAGAVILHPDRPIDGLGDSKALTANERDRLSALIMQNAAAWALGWACPREIDRLNIRMATHLAMKRAATALFHPFSLALIDGVDVPHGLPAPGRSLIGGDAREPAISAASILAKVARDRRMVSLERRYPGYGFAAHKGYGTRQHRDALETLGPCPAHRTSFRPVAVLNARLSA